MNDLDNAIKAYQRAVTDSVFSSEAAIRLADLYQTENKNDSALSILQNALNFSPAEIECWRALSKLLNVLHRKSEAIECAIIQAKLGGNLNLGGNVNRELILRGGSLHAVVDFSLFPWLTRDPFTAKKRFHKFSIYEKDTDHVISGRTDPTDHGDIEKQPVPIKVVNPDYPELALRARIQGTVWVNILIDGYGNAIKAVVMKSDADIFNEPARRAALQWKFSPAFRENGLPVAAWSAVPFRFKLNR